MDAGTTMKMGDTIIAGGVAASGGNCNLGVGATLTSLGHNAEDTDPKPESGAGGCQSYFTGPSDRTGLTLDRGAVQNNGGPSDTILPAAGCPVVDQGDPARCLPDDTYYSARVASTPDGRVTGPVESLTTQAAPVTVGGQPGPPVVCRAPKLKGDSLAKAKRVLAAAHCALCKVKRATRTPRKPVVVWQGFAAGTVHPAGFKVPIKLATKPAKRHQADEGPRS
jgi:hypothetical protein